jgi:hypothetical protein
VPTFSASSPFLLRSFFALTRFFSNSPNNEIEKIELQYAERPAGTRSEDESGAIGNMREEGQIHSSKGGHQKHPANYEKQQKQSLEDVNGGGAWWRAALLQHVNDVEGNGGGL